MFIKNFKQLSKNDTDIAGGKGASLGEMNNNKILDSRNSKTKNFLFLFEKIGSAQNLKKCRENFLFWTQTSSKFVGGALKVGIGIFRKKSSNFVQKAPQRTK